MFGTTSDRVQVSVIIVNYNGGDWLKRCVASVASQSGATYEVFIVDNGSTDGSLETLPALDSRFTIIRTGENLGFAAANNLAARRSRGEWLALLNPDAFARPNWLSSLLAHTQQSSTIKMVGSLQYMADDPTVLDGVGDYYHASGLAWRAGFGHPASHTPEKAHYAFGPCGAGALYHRQSFLHLGGFDERFFCYHEDVDIAYRFQLSGGRCIQSVTAIIDHVSSGISGRASDFAVYHGTRNRIWTFVKNTPALLLPILLPLHIALNLFMLFWAGIRSGRFKPTARGIIDALKGIKPIWQSRRPLKAHRKISRRDILQLLIWSPQPVRQRAIPQPITLIEQPHG